MWFTDLNKGMLNHRSKKATTRLQVYIYILDSSPSLSLLILYIYLCDTIDEGICVVTI